jgi:hypothetical protein
VNCKKLTLFYTNYPVKACILNFIGNNSQQLEVLYFCFNEVFPLDLFQKFKTKMNFLSNFRFVVNEKIGMVNFSHDEKNLCSKFTVDRAVYFYSNENVILFHQYFIIFSIPIHHQIVHFNNIPITSAILQSLIHNNMQLKELHIYDCNISLVIDSLREVFQKCKHLIHFVCGDFYNLMTPEHLQSLFSQPTTLQIIHFGCNPYITSSSLELMVQNSPLLTELCLHRLKGLDLTTLKDYMKNVRSCVKFTMKY